MTAQGQQPSPRLLQTSTKSSPSTQSSPLSAVANNETSPKHARVETANVSAGSNDIKGDTDAEKNTFTLIRRVLVADNANPSDPRTTTPKPVEELLPPLTSSNDVDVQLYVIIAIIVKEFVNSWYQNITTDRTFVEEVLQIIAHCSRALEQRLRKVDVETLLLDEVPVVLLRHIKGW